MTQAKICGINDPAAFDTAVEAGADWIGFVFFPPSPRYVTPSQAKALTDRSPGGPPRVGLFVRPSIDQIAAVLNVIPLDILQIYNADGDLEAIKSRFGLPVWRALGVVTRSDLPTTLGQHPGYLSRQKRLLGRAVLVETRNNSIGRFYMIGSLQAPGCLPVA